MKPILKKLYKLLVLFGFDPIKTYRSIVSLPAYFRDFLVLQRQSKGNPQIFPFKSYYPCLHDRQAASGSAKGHYFHQDLLVANRIYLDSPELHVDVGSRVDGFVAHVASFRYIEVFDIRNLISRTPNIKFKQANMMLPISKDMHEYCDSLSCLHALEHFGLGRYGDPIQYDGHICGLNNLYHMLKKNGRLYLSVPIGPQRIEFNAHRVFSIAYLMNLFKGKYHIDFFSFIDDHGDLYENSTLSDVGIATNFGCNYGCGIFELIKL